MNNIRWRLGDGDKKFKLGEGEDCHTVGKLGEYTLEEAIIDAGNKLFNIAKGTPIEGCPFFSFAFNKCIHDHARMIMDECPDEDEKYFLEEVWRDNINEDMERAIIELCGDRLECAKVKNANSKI